MSKLGYRFPIYSSKANSITLKSVEQFIDVSKKLEWNTSGRIIVIGFIAVGDGEYKSAYRLLKNNVNEVLMNAGGSLDVYYDGEDVQAEETGKDGYVSFYTYRELDENSDYKKLLEMIYYQKPVTNLEIKQYTHSLDEYMYAIYGI